MKLYIFRHGQTDGNVRNIVQGAGVDIELNETGRRQAERLAAELKGEGLDVIYASPMKRADETAASLPLRQVFPLFPCPGWKKFISAKRKACSQMRQKINTKMFSASFMIRLTRIGWTSAFPAEKVSEIL